MYNISWSERSEISSNLFNPAFICEVLRLCSTELCKNAISDNFKFEDLILCMPFILHKEYRASLPKTKRTKLHEWVQKNGELIIMYPEQVKSLLPYYREAFIFGIINKIFDVDDSGMIVVIKTRKPKYWDDILPETIEVLNAAKFVGKWMSTFPSTSISFALLGIKP